MIDFDSAPDSSSGRVDPPSSEALTLKSANGPAPDYIESLNDRQREAALCLEGPLMVLAGAGSGKTKMLTSRIAYLIDVCGVPAHHILAMTFTNKAAHEMRERVARHLAERSVFGSPEIGTFHSVCVRILRRESKLLGFTQPFVIYDDSDQLSLIKSVVNQMGIDDKAFSPKALQSSINRLKCDAVEPQEMQPAPHNIFEKQLQRVFIQYQAALKSNQAIDFGEIICMTYRLFRDHPEVRARYQHRFRYILVDEYQDTNRAQYLLLSMLAKKAYGGHENICVVGDEDQSIYKWRGADIHNILDFELDYPGAHVVKLEQNYRSTQVIINAASEVIKNNRQRKDKTLWTDNPRGDAIQHVQLTDERAEAEMIVSEIKRLAEAENRTYSEFAIFYRTHAQSRQFEDVLRREKVPYQIVGGLRFYDRKEIKDVLSYFKTILNPADSVSLKRIINVPGRGIGKTTLEKLDDLQTRLLTPSGIQATTEMAPGSTYWDVLSLAAKDTTITSAGTAKKIAGFVQLIQKLRDKRLELSLSELYHLILDETGYVNELKKEGTEEAYARVENLEEFDTLLQEFEDDILDALESDSEREAKKPELLELFVEQSSLASEADRATEGSHVQMMTLHSSKGLEYPVVFLPGMEEGLFPSVKPWEETPDEDIEEERRLCYVGMTRARERLYMTHVVVRRLWGNINYQEPARFFQELPEELADFKDLSYGSGATQYRAGSSRHFAPQPSWSSRGDDAPSPVILRKSSSGSGDSLVGRKINHPEYGKGTIVLSEGTGEDQKVMIEFQGKSRRKFVLRYVASYLE